MKKIFFSLIVLTAFLASGCLDIAERYILRADGQLTVKTDITIDPSIFKMIASMQSIGKDGETPAASETATEKDLVDSLVREIDKGLVHYRALPDVLSATATDSLGYDGVHIRTNVVLRSYHALASLPRLQTDSAGQMKSMLPKDSAVFIDSGDQVIFQVKNLPDSTLAAASGAVTSSDPAPVPIKKGHKGKTRKPAKKVVAEDSSSAMAGLGSMFNGLFSATVTLESPLLLGADTSATYDAANHTAVWRLDVDPSKAQAARAPMFRAWLRKP